MPGDNLPSIRFLVFVLCRGGPLAACACDYSDESHIMRQREDSVMMAMLQNGGSEPARAIGWQPSATAH
jgi:hypothetical protein